MKHKLKDVQATIAKAKDAIKSLADCESVDDAPDADLSQLRRHCNGALGFLTMADKHLAECGEQKYADKKAPRPNQPSKAPAMESAGGAKAPGGAIIV